MLKHADLRRDRDQSSRKFCFLRRFFHLHGSCGRRKRDNCGDHFFTHVFLFLPHTQKQDTGKPDIPFLLIFYLYEELPDYFAWIYPLAFRVSAQRTAPPAAPLTVL